MHKNNFNLLRLLFALFVIITHSFILTGYGEIDWLFTLTNAQVVISYIGVRGFFILSGYLIYQSVLRTTTLSDFFRNRFLRIFPGLIVVLLLTVILGYFVYNSDFYSYITNKFVWTYFPKNLKLFRLQGTIPGVFDTNPYKDDINGSIWTLQYEVICYSVISLLVLIRKKHLLILSALCLFFFVSNVFFFEDYAKLQFVIYGQRVIDFGTFFFAGSLLACLKIENFKYKNTLLYLALGLLVISLLFNVFRTVHLFALPVAVILIGISSLKYVSGILSSIGDLSYGIYIYAWPVQQTLVYFFHPGVYWLTVYTILITIVLGYMSWHLVEKPALKFKRHSGKSRFKTP